MSADRFYVGTVEGYTLQDGGTHGYAQPQTLHLTAHVLDRAYCRQVVASFRSDRLRRGTIHDNRAAAITCAEAVAAELNAWDADPDYVPARHATVRMIERGCVCRACMAAQRGRMNERRRRRRKAAA